MLRSIGDPKMSTAATSSPLIKGYLPVRLTLPSLDGNATDDTFFFVKEHHAVSSEKPGAATLFLANAPFVPGVQTRVLLRSLFGRYGRVRQVTVVENPRSVADTTGGAAHSSWTTRAVESSFFGSICSEGKFAHIVFESSKDMKKAIRSLRDVMVGKTVTKGELPGITLEKLEIQTLADETQRLRRQNLNQVESSSDTEDDDDSPQSSLIGILAVAERYRSNRRALSRSALLEECNAVMESFEDVEEADRHAREAAGNEPDDDGFVTVSYSSQAVGSKRELERGVASHNRRKATKRSRKKKKGIGSSELPDFYRFQMKESRKKSLHELRKRFEEDLAKVKKMKEEKQYRPF